MDETKAQAATDPKEQGATQVDAGAQNQNAAQPAQAAGDAKQQPQAQAEDFEALPAWAQKMVRELRKENASHRKATEAAEKQAAEQQGQFKALYEKEQQAREALEAKVRAAELSDLKRRAGAKYGLPEAIATRLQGDDEAAIFADAEIVAKAMPKTVAGNDAKAGTGAPNGVKTYGDLVGLEAVAQRYNIKLPQNK